MPHVEDNNSDDICLYPKILKSNVACAMPRYSNVRKCFHSALSVHLDYILKNGVTTKPKKPLSTPSYSLIHSLEDGFQVNLFSCTNNSIPNHFMLH